jgi:hypothetical protein
LSHRPDTREAGSGSDYVTLVEGLALLPLLPDPVTWSGERQVTIDIESTDRSWKRLATFRLHTVITHALSQKRWVLINPILMDGTSLELIARGALADEEGIEAVALLLTEKMDLQRKVTLLSEELRVSAYFDDDPDGERDALHDSLEALMRERDLLHQRLMRAEEQIERLHHGE